MKIRSLTFFIFIFFGILHQSFGLNNTKSNGCYCEMKESNSNLLLSAAPDTTMEYISVPNAFMPYNPLPILTIFKPIVNHKITNYKMLIFDRWGSLIFETKDTEIGWDGSYKGKMCAVQSYVYKISYQPILPDGSIGEERVKVGSITLLE